jgi:hypothetical protein
VGHHGEEARFGPIGRFGLIARLGQRAFGLDPVGDVASDALRFAAAIGAHGDLAPGDPALAGRRSDLLIVSARAVGQ